MPKLIHPAYAASGASSFLQNNNPVSSSFNTLGDIVSALLPYLFIFAGLIMFAMILFGGFQILASATNPDKAEAGKKKVTSAIAGFFLLFSAYWIIQLVETITGLNLLG